MKSICISRYNVAERAVYNDLTNFVENNRFVDNLNNPMEYLYPKRSF